MAIRSLTTQNAKTKPRDHEGFHFSILLYFICDVSCQKVDVSCAEMGKTKTDCLFDVYILLFDSPSSVEIGKHDLNFQHLLLFCFSFGSYVFALFVISLLSVTL